MLEEVAEDYLNLGVAIFDVDGGLILAFNFSSLAYAVLILKLTAHLCWKRLLWTIPQSWSCHLRCRWWVPSSFAFNFSSLVFVVLILKLMMAPFRKGVVRALHILFYALATTALATTASHQLLCLWLPGLGCLQAFAAMCWARLCLEEVVADHSSILELPSSMSLVRALIFCV